MHPTNNKICTDVEAVGDKEDVVHLRSKHVQHYLAHKLPGAKFVLALPPNWYLNLESSLPQPVDALQRGGGEGQGERGGEEEGGGIGIVSKKRGSKALQVIADGTNGPVVCVYTNCLMLACDVEGKGGETYTSVRR